MADKVTKEIGTSDGTNVYVPVASTDTAGVAKFNSEDFAVSSDGTVSSLQKTGGIQYMGDSVSYTSDNYLLITLSKYSAKPIEDAQVGDLVMLMTDTEDEAHGGLLAGYVFAITSVYNIAKGQVICSGQPLFNLRGPDSASLYTVHIGEYTYLATKQEEVDLFTWLTPTKSDYYYGQDGVLHTYSADGNSNGYSYLLDLSGLTILNNPINVTLTNAPQIVYGSTDYMNTVYSVVTNISVAVYDGDISDDNFVGGVCNRIGPTNLIFDMDKYYTVGYYSYNALQAEPANGTTSSNPQYSTIPFVPIVPGATYISKYCHLLFGADSTKTGVNRIFNGGSGEASRYVDFSSTSNTLSGSSGSLDLTQVRFVKLTLYNNYVSYSSQAFANTNDTYSLGEFSDLSDVTIENNIYSYVAKCSNPKILISIHSLTDVDEGTEYANDLYNNITVTGAIEYESEEVGYDTTYSLADDFTAAINAAVDDKIDDAISSASLDNYYTKYQINELLENISLDNYYNKSEVIEQIQKAMYEQSPLYGLKVGWIGTSITNAYGWCKIVNEAFGFTTEDDGYNGNYGLGGTCMFYNSGSSQKHACMCSDVRLSGDFTYVNGGSTIAGKPLPKDLDILFVEAGTNDWAQNAQLGDKDMPHSTTVKTVTIDNDAGTTTTTTTITYYDGTSETTTDTTDTTDDDTAGTTTTYALDFSSQTASGNRFYHACHRFFYNVQNYAPNTVVIIVGTVCRSYASSIGYLNSAGLAPVDYGDALLEIGGHWGHGGTNVARSYGVNVLNVRANTTDGIHPSSTTDHQLIAYAFMNYLLTIRNFVKPNPQS